MNEISSKLIENHKNLSKLDLVELIENKKGEVLIEDIKELTNSDSINQEGNNGMTPLHYSCYYGKYDLTNFLINSGADIEKIDQNFLKPIYYALENNFIDIIELFINILTSEKINEFYKDVFIYSCRIGSLELASIYLNKITDINKQDEFGWNSLHHATSKGFANIVDFLLNNGADINFKSFEQWTPLIIACNFSLYSIVDILLNKKECILENRDNYGRTALHWACMKNNKEIIELILLKISNINEKDDDGRTALHHSCLDSSIEGVRLLVKNGIMINSIDNLGNSALHYAARKLCPEIIKILMSNEADIEIPDKNGESAAQVALGYKQKENFDLLMKR